MSTNTLLDAIGALKQIEAIAGGKTTRKLTPQQRLDLCEFAARSMAGDLAYQVKALARKSAEAVTECEAMTQPQPAHKRATKRK
jgi:hypothetical protein